MAQLERMLPEIDVALLEEAWLDIPAAVAVQDLHVRTITSGADAMSGYLVVTDRLRYGGLWLPHRRR